MVKESGGAARSQDNKKTELWDNLSENFDGFRPQTPENNDILKFLRDRGALLPHFRVLDIGCAAGKYAFAFSRYCREVVALDISPKMLARAEANKALLKQDNVTFMLADWEELSLDQIGGPGSFDLVFANMSPGVASQPAFDKMMAASCGYCYYGGSSGRQRLINDRIYELLGLAASRQGGSQRFPEIFRRVWSAGFRPYLEYVNNDSKTDMTLERAISYYESAAEAMARL